MKSYQVSFNYGGKKIQVLKYINFSGTGGRYGGQIQLPSTTITVRPKVTVSASAGAVTPGMTTVRTIAPSTASPATQTMRLANNTTVQVRTPTTTAATPAPTTPSGQVQNLRIIQGPNGQIQVQGLLPGEWGVEFIAGLPMALTGCLPRA